MSDIKTFQINENISLKSNDLLKSGLLTEKVKDFIEINEMKIEEDEVKKD